MDEYAQELYESVTAAVPGWIERSIRRVLAGAGEAPASDVAAAALAAGRQAQAEVEVELKALLETDIDEQDTTPLSILRAAVSHATAVLLAAGVPAVERDETQHRLFPDDTYDLTPATLGDVDPGLTDPGLVWGAYKARAHLQRHGSP